MSAFVRYSRDVTFEDRGVHPLLTDLYEFTMAYGYWKSGKTLDFAVFDLYFRKNPFEGEFTIFAGLEECLKFIQNFKLSHGDINYLRSVLPPTMDKEFFNYLSELTTDEVTVYAPPEGTVMFPKVPLMRIEGPVIITQILETTLLNLVNFASLITTNAVRFRLAVGDDVKLIEMGLRRAQGPDGAVTASRYAYIGGFDFTSNCLAGKLFNIPCSGTQAHSYVTAFTNISELKQTTITKKNENLEVDLVKLTLQHRQNLANLIKFDENLVHDGELASFISWAIAYPNNYFALVDTYEVRQSGLYNFCSVALSLHECGYQAVGVRIDSGDLAYLSNFARDLFKTIAYKYNIPYFAQLKICASNGINEKTIYSLKDQKHSIDMFGVGTHLVTCQSQPALGGVYKLVELDEIPRMKITEEQRKATFPGKKIAYRLYGEDCALVDLITLASEDAPKINEKILGLHPYISEKRAYVVPIRCEKLHEIVFHKGQIVRKHPTTEEVRQRVKDSLKLIRSDVKRHLNPTPYKVSFSEELFKFVHDFWLATVPIGCLK